MADMFYNADMSGHKQKIALYLPKEPARRFDLVFRRVKERNKGRADWSEVIRELMGFPLKEGEEPLVTDEDRQIIVSGCLEFTPEIKQPTGTAGRSRMISAKTGKEFGRGQKNN